MAPTMPQKVMRFLHGGIDMTLPPSEVHGQDNQSPASGDNHAYVVAACTSPRH
jgi:hypothetical protein